MTRISSRATFVYKRLFPLVWFGFVAAFIAIALYKGTAQAAPMSIVAPCVMAILGYVIFRRLVWVLVDEVFDAGDYLLVRNRGREERIPLANIMNVGYSTLTNPARVMLRLVKAGELGPEVVFWPRRSFRFNPFGKNPIVEDLIVRVYHARDRRAATA